MRLKKYLNEEKLYNQKLLEEIITYDFYCKILDSDNIDVLIEGCLNEGKASEDAKKRGLKYIGFGRYATKDKPDTVVAVSKSDKLVDIEPRKAERAAVEDDEEKAEGSEDSDKIRIKNVATKLKNHVLDISNDLKVSKDHVIEAFKKPRVYNVLKHFGFSVGNLAKASSKAVSTLNVGLKGVFEEIVKTKAAKKLRSGAIKVDEFLDKHPPLKKITGVAVGGFMMYQWLNMTFSGDINDDYDLSALPLALKGEYGMKELLGTASGLKGLTQLGIGMATGGLPIWVAGTKGITLALTYSGAKLAKNIPLVKKTKAKIKEFWDEKTKEEK